MISVTEQPRTVGTIFETACVPVLIRGAGHGLRAIVAIEDLTCRKIGLKGNPVTPPVGKNRKQPMGSAFNRGDFAFSGRGNVLHIRRKIKGSAILSNACFFKTRVGITRSINFSPKATRQQEKNHQSQNYFPGFKE